MEISASRVNALEKAAELLFELYEEDAIEHYNNDDVMYLTSAKLFVLLDELGYKDKYGRGVPEENLEDAKERLDGN